jgi:23S rRNA pseudouridine2605 synthase
MQLSKYIAHAGVCARRKAADLITSGAVLVNGVAVKEWAYRVQPTDRVECQGREIKPEEPVYVVLNKPTGVVTSVAEKGATTVLGCVNVDKRVYPVGRLESTATGVVLLTNDGDLTKRLVHIRGDAAAVERCYKVTLTRRLDRRARTIILEEGVRLPEGIIKPDSLYPVQGRPCEWFVSFSNDQSRFMRRMFHRLGHVVRHFECVSFAGLTAEGLERGQWRALKAEEIAHFKALVSPFPTTSTNSQAPA